MRYISVLIVGLSLASCSAPAPKIPGTNLKAKSFELDYRKMDSPTMSFPELEREIDMLNKYIGSYPPRFSSEAERVAVHEQWLSRVAEAEAYGEENSNTEKSLYLLSELYRQGHNMDVRGSAERAFRNIESCLEKYEKSVACNFSASYFYLSIGPKYLDNA